MPPVCLSVGTFWYERSSTVFPCINARFTRNEAPILGEHRVHFKMFLIHVVCCLQRFECQDLDNSCQNFTYTPAKTQPRQNYSSCCSLIYTTFFAIMITSVSGCGSFALYRMQTTYRLGLLRDYNRLTRKM